MSNYWKQRIEEEMKAKQAQDAQIGDELKRLHQHHMRNIQLEIDGFLAQYGANNQLTPVEVKKRVSELDVVSFQEKAKRYVDEKNFSKQANDELALYNLKMKVSRLEMLQYHMDLEMVALADSEMKLTEKFLNAEFIQEMNLQAGILGEVIPKPRLIQGMAQGIINTPYEGAVWSERIWQRQTKLRTVVAAMTNETLLRGRNATTMVSDIQKMFDVSAYEAKRLAVTETARIQTAVHKEMYGVNEIDEYEYLAEPGACKVCAVLNGKTFKVSEMEPGKNASPMHPHCHCSDAPDVSAARVTLDKISIQTHNTDENMGQRQAANISQKSVTNNFSVDRKLVNSKMYHDKFEKLPFSKNVNESLYKSSIKILEHRDGSNLEDLFIIDARTGREITKNISAKEGFRVGLSNAQYSKVLKEDSIIILHNHPEGGRLSPTDIKTLFETPNAIGSVVVGHDGSVFVVHSPNRKVSIADVYDKVYNEYVGMLQNKEMATIKATDTLYKMGVFSYGEIK